MATVGAVTRAAPIAVGVATASHTSKERTGDLMTKQQWAERAAKKEAFTKAIAPAFEVAKDRAKQTLRRFSLHSKMTLVELVAHAYLLGVIDSAEAMACISKSPPGSQAMP